MNWLSPWFLLGAVAIAGPLIAHLRRRDDSRILLLPTQRFVAERKPPETKRRRLQDVLLFLLRALALGAVSLAFARPFFDADPGALAEPKRRVVVLVDRSASLRGSGEGQVREALRKLGAGLFEVADVSVAFFDGGVREVLAAEEWAKGDGGVRKALWEKMVGEWAPGWGGTGLDEALRYASVRMGGEDGLRARSGEVEVVSDFQQGSRIAGARDLPWPVGVGVRLHRVGSEEPTASVRWLPSEEGVPVKEWRFEVRSKRSGGRVMLMVDGADAQGRFTEGKPETLDLKDGQRRVVIVPLNAAGLVRVRVGEGKAAEEVAYAAAKARRAVRVAVAGKDDAGSPGGRHFFETAIRAHGEVEILPDGAEGASLVAWTGGADRAMAPALANRVREGAVGVLWAGDGLEGDVLKELTGSDFELGAAEDRTVLVAGIDRSHWVMRPMVQARFDDLSGVRFWRVRRLVPSADARVVLSFDDGRPALVEVPSGQGSWLVWACGLAPQDSQLGLSTRFLPWLSGIMEKVRGEGGDVRSVLVGRKATGAMGVRKVFPVGDGPAVEMDAPSVYEGEDGTRWVASVPPEELQREPIADPQLRALGLPLEEVRRGGADGDEPRARGARVAERLEAEQSLWKRVIWGVVMILLLESFIAGRRSRTTVAST